MAFSVKSGARQEKVPMRKMIYNSTPRSLFSKPVFLSLTLPAGWPYLYLRGGDHVPNAQEIMSGTEANEASRPAQGGKMDKGKGPAKWVTFLVFVIAVTVGFSYGQRLTGKIMGTVTDEQGELLPGVTAELASPALMGGVYSEMTSAKGTYRFTNLPPGMYTLVFSLKGFQTVKRLEIKTPVV